MRILNPIFLTFLLLLISKTVWSQPDEIQFEIEIKNPEDFKILPDEQGYWAAYLSDARNYYFKLISPQGKVLRTRILKRSMRDNKQYLGAMSTEKGFCMFFKDKDSLTPRSYTSYFLARNDSNDVHYSGAFVLDKKEELIKAFSVGNSFYLLTINKKNNTLYFLKFIDGSHFERHPFIMNDDHIKSFSKGDFRVFKENQIATIFNLTAEKKLFLDSEDNFVYIRDNRDDITGTEVIRLKLSENKAEYTLLTAVNTNAVQYGKTSTWYQNGNIFKYVQGDGYISFFVQDISTQKIIKKYTYSKGDTFNIMTGKLNHQKDHAYYDVKDVVEKNKAMYRKLIGGFPFIKTETHKDGKVAFLAGTYNEVKQAPVGGPNVFTGPGMMLLTGGTAGGSYIEVNWFTSYLNDSTFTIDPEPAPKPDIIALEEYLEKLSRSDCNKQDIVQIKMNNTIFLAYISKKEKLVKIVKVREIN
jgi:hypothetical protein